LDEPLRGFNRERFIHVAWLADGEAVERRLYKQWPFFIIGFCVRRYVMEIASIVETSVMSAHPGMRFQHGFSCFNRE
jgi:hypothetical protein